MKGLLISVKCFLARMSATYQASPPPQQDTTSHAECRYYAQNISFSLCFYRTVKQLNQSTNMEVLAKSDADATNAVANAVPSSAPAAVANEFGDDDEFASFDMEAALSSTPENIPPNTDSTPAKRIHDGNSCSSREEKRFKTPNGPTDSSDNNDNESPEPDLTTLSPSLETALQQSLRQHFSHSTFRPGQLPILQAILNQRDACVFWATGAGKSMCYQLPPLHLHQVGVVITPLVSLMMDQVNKLNASRADGKMVATYLGSAQKDASMEQRVMQGEFRLVYVTPEKLVNGSFLERLSGMHGRGGKGTVCLFAVDERLVNLFVCLCIAHYFHFDF